MSKKSRLDELDILKNFIEHQTLEMDRLTKDPSEKNGMMIILAAFVSYQRNRRWFIENISIEEDK